jgi:hypothetical protein
MDNYAPNSRKFKEQQKAEPRERKKVEKVVTGKVKTKKKSKVRNFTDNFVSEDASSVKSYIISDVLIPAVKKTISDIVRDGIDMILYGDTRRHDKSYKSYSSVSYRDYSRRDDYRHKESRSRSGYDCDDIILESRGEVEEVLAMMDDLLATYNFVSVADLYDLVGKNCNYTDNNYGWTNLSSAEPIRCRDGGYLIKLPKPRPID